MNLKIYSLKKKSWSGTELTQGTSYLFLLPPSPRPRRPPPFFLSPSLNIKNQGSQRPPGTGKGPWVSVQGPDHLGRWCEPWAAFPGRCPLGKWGAWESGHDLLKAAARSGRRWLGQSLQTAAWSSCKADLDTRTPPPPFSSGRPHHSLSLTFLLNNQGLVLAAEGATELAGRGGGDVMDS